MGPKLFLVFIAWCTCVIGGESLGMVIERWRYGRNR